MNAREPIFRRLGGGYVLALLAVIALAAALRLPGIGFGLPALNDSDELMFELGATRMLTGPTLNPGWFGHPATTTMYILALVNASTFALGWIAGLFPDPEGFMRAIYADPGIVIMPGRVAMAVFGLVTIWQSAQLARAAASDGSNDGKWAGLFAALMLASSTLHVNYSQIIRSDMVGTVFILMTVAAALRIARAGKAADYGWAALGVALAVASKWPFGIAAVSVAGAVAFRIAADRSCAGQQLKRFAGFLVLAPLLLILVSPYLILDYPTVLRNLGGEAQTQHLGATGEGLLANMWWYLKGPLREAFGLPGLALAGAGVLLLFRDRAAAFVILPVLLAYAVMICLHGLRWERWVLPMLPFLAVAAGVAAQWLLSHLALPGKARLLALAAGIGLIAVPAGLARQAQLDASARMHDTRQKATAWARQHVPPGSVVMIEHFAFDLIDAPWTILFPMGDAGCVDAKAMLAGKISYKVVDEARGSRANVDYGTVAAGKRDTCQSDFVILMEMERYRAERDRFPNEYGAYAALLDDMKVLASIRPEPGRSSGPVMTIMGRKQGQP